MLWPTVSWPIRLAVGHPFGTNDQIFLFPFYCRIIALLFVLESLLWREDGSAICSPICQWPESQRTHNHILLFHLRLLSSLFSPLTTRRDYGGSILTRLHTGRLTDSFEVEVEVILRLTVSQYVLVTSTLVGLVTRSLRLKLICDRRSVGQCVLVSGSCLEPVTRSFFSVWQLWVSWCSAPSLTRGCVCNLLVQFLLGLARAGTLGSKSRRTRDHILLSHLRLPQPGGPGSRIYIPQEQGGPVIPPDTGLPDPY
jgi:hypothetical protein